MTSPQPSPGEKDLDLMNARFFCLSNHARLIFDCNLVVIILLVTAEQFFVNHYFCRVKTIFFIFSIYLLLLPGITCAGTDNCSDIPEHAVSQATNHADDDEDGCGSFCTCSCCVHIVSVNFQSPVISIDKPIEKNTTLSFYHNISLPSNYFGNIWQPPRSV